MNRFAIANNLVFMMMVKLSKETVSFPIRKCVPRYQILFRLWTAIIALLLGCAGVSAAETSSRLNLDGEWQMGSTETINDSGERISMADYVPQAWMKAQVPGTTLGAYVASGIYPEPTFDLNNKLYPDENGRLRKGLIPDISIPGSVFTFPRWWRTTFTIPPAWKGRTVWLNLDGVNWSAKIYVNGHTVGVMKGAFKRGIFDISPALTTGTNALAVKIIPPPVPGSPKSNGCGGDRTFGLTPATIYQTVGWDFTIPDGVRDRNTGIYRDVFLSATGPVRIADPFMSTVGVPGDNATLAFRTWLVNASNVRQKGVLNLDFDGGKASVEIELLPNESREIFINHTQCSGLVVTKPRLWWPNGRGKPELYNLTVAFTINGTVSDTVKTHFGIRSIEHDTFHGQNTWKINGKRLFMPGGVWVQDALLRQSPKRYNAEVRMIAQAGLTWLRVWSGSGIERGEFFDTCDRYGILVWVEAGLTRQTPLPTNQIVLPAYKECVFDNWADTVRRLRNHPCIFHWCGCNEDTDIDGMRSLALINDGTRDYQANSADIGQRGSPYTFQGISCLYDYTGKDVWGCGPLGIFGGFCDESGNPNLPNAECLREQMPASKLWPINEETFRYQDGGGFHNTLGFVQKGCARYGRFDVPDMTGRVGVENYAFKGQLLGAMQYRADCELWQRNKWNTTGKWATGYALWTVNTTHPQVVSRLYHYSLEPNAALWYVAHANKSLHAQYDYFANDVSAVNNSWNDATNLTVEASVHNLDWSTQWSAAERLDRLPAEQTRTGVILVPAKDTPGFDDTHFIYVELKDAYGKAIDDMIYWRARRDPGYGCDGPFTALNNMPPARLDLATAVRLKGNTRIVNVKLKNSGKGLAFFIRLKILGAASKKLIRPCFYSDNGFSVLPGQTKSADIEIDNDVLAGERPVVAIEGWNIGPTSVKIPGKTTTPDCAMVRNEFPLHASP